MLFRSVSQSRYWTILSEIYLTEVSRTSTSVTFDLEVLYDTFNGKYQLEFSRVVDGANLLGAITDSITVASHPSRLKTEVLSLQIGVHTLTLEALGNDPLLSSAVFRLLTSVDEFIDQIEVIYSNPYPE